jgi:hypothetical protein
MSGCSISLKENRFKKRERKAWSEEVKKREKLKNMKSISTESMEIFFFTLVFVEPSNIDVKSVNIVNIKIFHLKTTDNALASGIFRVNFEFFFLCVLSSDRMKSISTRNSKGGMN